MTQIDIAAARHPKESVYFGVAAAVGAILWLVLLVSTVGLVIPCCLALIIGLWVAGQLYKAALLGNAVRVSDRQHPALHAMLVDASTRTGIAPPECFLVNGQGLVNAAAVRFLYGRYVLLMSGLVDLMLKRGAYDELRMIVAHEVAHHAAGHTSLGKRFIVLPAMAVPFLGAAYGRACELTADRIGALVTNDDSAAMRALVSLAIGSEHLASDTDIDEFVRQDRDVPPIAGLITELYSTHPRMTKRVMELRGLAGRPADPGADDPVERI